MISVLNKSVLQKIFAPLFLIYGITSSNTSFAIEVVRADFSFQDVSQSVDFSLFDTTAKDTVNNFLSYVGDGSYNKLIVNRSIPGFVVQAGGYTFDPQAGIFSYTGNGMFDGGLQPVPTKGSILNDFKLSNLRGTLAMARKQYQVNSASNEWFINLADNSFLDSVDEGFTVFGEVLGSGMQTIDAIATVETFSLFTGTDISGSFADTPLNNYTTSSVTSDISNSNLVMINSFDRLFSITDTIDFGEPIVGNLVTRDIVIKNNNSTPLQIGVIDISSIAAPFSVTPCANKLLQPGEACIIQVEFNPTTIGYFANRLNVEILTYGYTFPVTIKTPSPALSIEPDAVNFGAQPVYDPATLPKYEIIYLYNKGDRTLNLSSIQFNTQTPNDFEFIDNCIQYRTIEPGILPPGEFCIFVLNFKPTDLFEKFASIDITSNDPLNQLVSIPITGGASTDNDGLDNAIEDAVPNNGDNNNDGIPDRLQNNVASFQTANGIYTTLITDKSLSFTAVAPLQLSSLAEPPPAGTVLKNEAFSFELSGFPVGSVAKFGLILPEGASPSNIYSFGPTLDNNTPHWYALDKNTSPGVFAFGNYSLVGTAGNITRNLTNIEIQDGGYGDSDLQANGKILFIGAPEMMNAPSNDSGSMIWLLFLTPVLIMLARRNVANP